MIKNSDDAGLYDLPERCAESGIRGRRPCDQGFQGENGGQKKGSGQPEAYSQKSGTSVQYHVHGDSGGRRGHDEQLPKMQEMETVLVSVLPEGARPWDPDREEREESAPVIVEEIKGRIYPKTEEESNRLVGSSAGGEKGEEIVKMEPDPEKTAEIQEKQDLSQETALESSAPELPAEAQPESQNSGDGLREPESQGAEFQKSESQTEDPSAESRETQADGNPKAQASEHQGSETASQETKEAAAPVTDKKPGGTYAVGDGETLYGICFKLYGNVNHVEDICALNGMTDMNHVAAGQKLILPADVPVAEEMKDLVEK